MAHLVEIFCKECKTMKQEMVGGSSRTPSICYECDIEIKVTNRKKHFEKLDKLTMKQRLRLVEEWQYDYIPPSRVPQLIG